MENTRKICTALCDFDGLARRIAKQLCEPEIRVGDSEHPDSGEADFSALLGDGLPPSMYAFTEPPSLVATDIDTLRTAMNLGGSEFLRLVLDE